ncbi:hypothetical protein PoB_007168100 [Plakobranchus ocellatus]|uniref:Uncharacterized protein n=1 Tax=Plakobranchus ocellatus TaxID=259542 RepID=A0AAV4DMJ8_9GAST|nr:hypothetical protein PoB_007168100 [Plakobranchus ocellatus]
MVHPLLWVNLRGLGIPKNQQVEENDGITPTPTPCQDRAISENLEIGGKLRPKQRPESRESGCKNAVLNRQGTRSNERIRVGIDTPMTIHGQQGADWGVQDWDEEATTDVVRVGIGNYWDVSGPGAPTATDVVLVGIGTNGTPQIRCPLGDKWCTCGFVANGTPQTKKPP